jgi:ATP-dependent helicase YprA (DUF1998 family)
VHLVRRYPGYKKIRYYSHDNIGYGNIDLPDQEMHTTSVWWQVHPTVLEQALPSRERAIEGFLGAAYALHHVAALRAMAEVRTWAAPSATARAAGSRCSATTAAANCAGRTTSRWSRVPGDRFEPTLFLYDNFPGGVGLSAPLFDAAGAGGRGCARPGPGLRLPAGCPACIGPVLPGDEQRAQTPKQAALTVLLLLSPSVRRPIASPTSRPWPSSARLAKIVAPGVLLLERRQSPCAIASMVATAPGVLLTASQPCRPTVSCQAWRRATLPAGPLSIPRPAGLPVAPEPGSLPAGSVVSTATIWYCASGC